MGPRTTSTRSMSDTGMEATSIAPDRALFTGMPSTSTRVRMPRGTPRIEIAACADPGKLPPSVTPRA